MIHLLTIEEAPYQEKIENIHISSTASITWWVFCSSLMFPIEPLHRSSSINPVAFNGQ